MPNNSTLIVSPDGRAELAQRRRGRGQVLNGLKLVAISKPWKQSDAR